MITEESHEASVAQSLAQGFADMVRELQSELRILRQHSIEKLHGGDVRSYAKFRMDWRKSTKTDITSFRMMELCHLRAIKAQGEAAPSQYDVHMKMLFDFHGSDVAAWPQEIGEGIKRQARVWRNNQLATKIALHDAIPGL